MRRRGLLALGAGAFTEPLAALAQQQSQKVHRVGFLGTAAQTVLGFTGVSAISSTGYLRAISQAICRSNVQPDST
jgi:hypothetical protein